MMLDQLKEKQLKEIKKILKMQRVLDESIFKAKGINDYPFDNMKVALIVELGELMNEFPTKFKHWKSSAVDNREKGLVEYVDCLHFALSLYNLSYNDVNYDYDSAARWNKLNYGTVLHYIVHETYDEKLYWLFALGNKLGFTWEEIYSAYKKKNEINYKRLKEGY